MTFSYSLIDGDYKFEVQDSTGKYVGHALAALSQNGLYWDFKEIKIDENKRRNKYGTRLMDYARSHLWNIEELPIRAHVGIDPTNVVKPQVDPLLNPLDINKKFYYKCGFEEELDRKHFVCFPANYQP